MNKFLAFIIIFFLLGSNVVSAFDAMDLGLEHENQGNAPDQSNDSSDHMLESDHCCHGTAHLIGILIGNTEVISLAVSHIVTANTDTHTFLAYRPPLPPPNS